MMYKRYLGNNMNIAEEDEKIKFTSKWKKEEKKSVMED